MEEFKNFEDPESMSIHIHGWFLPQIKKLKAEKFLRKNKTKQQNEDKIIEFDYEKWKYYDGDVDPDGKAFGNGTAINLDNILKEYKGTFKDDLPHGFGKINFSLSIFWCRCIDLK